LSKEETTVKGRRFQDVEHIKKNATAELNALPLDMFSDAFMRTFRKF
jgi:hypothetical protein